jgi:hypothetical protein
MTSALYFGGVGHGDCEKRGAPRMQVQTLVTIIPCGGRGDRRPHKVTLLNISETGVAINHPPAMKRGDQFVLRLPPAHGRPLSAILCVVNYSRLMADGSEVVGAQFHRMLTIGGAPALADGSSQEERDYLEQLEQRLTMARDQKTADHSKGDA